ncbi:MAG: phosphomannomutase/phosphoglucomutase [Candidatus Flexifilum sp.]|jgi:phosphomannomutase/phosphoglucomutase
MIERGLFKKYDIRGRAEGDGAPLTPQAAHLIGRAFGAHLRAAGRTEAIVGQDNRRTSPALAGAVSAGLSEAGIAVQDIGLTSTPVVYWYAMQQDEAGAVMVTGSHLAPEQNGFKLAIGVRNLYGDAIAALHARIAAGDLPTGDGSIMHLPAEAIRERYQADLLRRVWMARPLTVVVDAGSGTAGLIAPDLFEGWGHTVIRLYCEPDAAYPHHHPDPQEPRNLADLAAKVVEVGADIGIAFDGDADRMGAVDETGQIIPADRLLTLLALDLLQRQPGAAIVADVLTSQTFFDAVAGAGGRPELWASGHSLVKAHMAEIGAPLGGEMSGHIFLGEDYYGCDDAYLAAGRLLNLIGAADRPLSVLNAALPAYVSTPEYRPRCPDEDKASVIAGVRAALADDPAVRAITEVDGIRIQYDAGWGLLRASNTEPVLSLRFEGRTEADALAIRRRFFDVLRTYPVVTGLPD